METVEKPPFNPYLAVLLAVMCVSTSAIFVRLSTAHPMMIAFYRMGLSALFLAPLALNRSGRKELQGMNSSGYNSSDDCRAFPRCPFYCLEYIP